MDKFTPDPLYKEAKEIIGKNPAGFILAIQRGLNVGYNRASHLLEAIIEEGFITIVENGKDQWRYRIM